SGADAAFVDPARRGARGRTFRPEQFSPPYSFVLDLARRVPATAAKLAPGIPHDVLPEGAEAEWVSVDGDVVECMLWSGPLVTAPRRATVLPEAATLAGDGAPARLDDRVRHGRPGGRVALRDRLRGSRRAAVRPQAAPHAAARARG